MGSARKFLLSYLRQHWIGLVLLALTVAVASVGGFLARRGAVPSHSWPYVAATGAVVVVLLVLWLVPKRQVATIRSTAGAKDALDFENKCRVTLAQIVGGVAVLAGVVVSWQQITSSIASRQQEMQQDQAQFAGEMRSREETQREANAQIQNQLEATLESLKVDRERLASEMAATRVRQELDRERLITDRFVRAVEQLGNRDSLDVRLGGIYALERIARDSRKDYWTVMEVLTAYVRENAKWTPPATSGVADGESGDSPAESPQPKADIQAILTVLGRRHRAFEEGGQRLDLRGTDLRRADLKDSCLARARLATACLMCAELRGADLSDAILWGADLRGAWLEGANLREADLSGADLRGAWLERAKARRASLWQADLRDANLSHADLRDTDMRSIRGGGEWKPLETEGGGIWIGGANLCWADLRGACLEDADLTGAELFEADLRGAVLGEPERHLIPDLGLSTYPGDACLRGANLKDADLRGVYLREVQGLTREQIERAITDGKTKLPDHLLD